MSSPALVWFRDDLRLADHPALDAAVRRGGPLVLVYVLDDTGSSVRPLGSATRWWLHGSLAALGAEIERRGGRLVLRRGAAETEIARIVRETGARAVFWNRRYGPARETDARLTSTMRAAGITVETFAANLLVEPGAVTTREGGAFRVFTPFWRAALDRPMRDPLAAPSRLAPPPRSDLASDELDDWRLLPTRPDWAGGLRETWAPGEAAARDALERFASEGLPRYDRRDEPAVAATSRLSPHVRFGELSPAQIWRRVHEEPGPEARRNVAKFASELGWREFCAHLLHAFPDLAQRNVRPEFDRFPWIWDTGAELDAWQRGRTGVPLVDAGMRELWRTGTMHNRVRMVVASFLVKNLLRHWRLGEEWFWNTLVDADEASNPANWQWVAGSGADAAPYFRVFNPELQAARFDPEGTYVRRWVAEFGTPDYPPPIVDLAASRRDALAAYSAMTGR